MARMRILTPAEQAAFDTPPVFTHSERQKFFAIPTSVGGLLVPLRTPANQVGFLVMLGYFRATKRFFARQFHDTDVRYVARLLDIDAVPLDLDTYEKSVQSRHRQVILEYLGFRPFDEHARHAMAQEIQTMIRAQMRPKPMLLRVLELLEYQKIAIPSAYALTDLVLTEMARYQRTLTALVEANLSTTDRTLLDALLEKVDSDAEQDLPLRRFRLTLLKTISQSTRPSKIRAAVDDLRILQQVYQQLEPLLQALDLSPDGIRHYAHAVLKTAVFHFARREDEDRYLHLVCFTAHQFFRMQDALIDVLLTAVQTILNTCQRTHKEQSYRERPAQRRAMRTFVAGVTHGAVQPLAEIETLAFSRELSDSEKVREMQDVLTRGLLQRPLVHEQLAYFTEQSQTAEDAGYYAILEAQSIRLQNRVAAIIQALALEGDDEGLMAAIAY